MQIKLGTDPETFLKLGNKFITADGVVPGTKDNPFAVDKGAVQVDGTALEFNIHPAETAEEFDKNITVVLTQIKEMVKKVDKDIEIVFTPIAKFDAEYFANLPLKSKILGCDPDWNIRGGIIEKDEKQINNPIRTAAGHIHIGFTENESVNDPVHFEDCRFLAEHFYRLGRVPYAQYGVLSLEEQERLKYYGGNGAFRPKPYGVELRQYSNLWVQRSATRINSFNFIKSKVESLAK